VEKKEAGRINLFFFLPFLPPLSSVPSPICRTLLPKGPAVTKLLGAQRTDDAERDRRDQRPLPTPSTEVRVPDTTRLNVDLEERRSRGSSKGSFFSPSFSFFSPFLILHLRRRLPRLLGLRGRKGKEM